MKVAFFAKILSIADFAVSAWFYGKVVVFRSESRSVWNILTGTFSILFVLSDAPDVVCYQGRSQLVEFSISVAKLAT